MQESSSAGHPWRFTATAGPRRPAAAARKQPPRREHRSHDHRELFRSAHSRSPDRTASMKRPQAPRPPDRTSTSTRRSFRMKKVD
jgi:hypothetical protein